MNYPGISFEVIPRGADRIDEVRATVAEGLKLNPLYIDMSFGGGGRPDVDGEIRRQMRLTIAAIREFTKVVPIVPHLSRTGLDVKNTQAFVEELANAGIYRFLLVGGDQPNDDKIPRFRDADCYKETTDLITDVCDTFKFMGLGDKLELAVAVEPEGYRPVDRLKEKIAASAITLPGHLKPIYAVKEAVTQNYTKTGIIYPFLTQVIQAGIEILIVPGVNAGAGIPRPAVDKEGKEVRRNGVLIDRFGVPLHQNYLDLFKDINRADRSPETLARIVEIHRKRTFHIVHELSVGQIGPGDVDIVIDRMHGFTHNGKRFFDIVRQVYPGIEDAPPPASRTYGAQARPGPNA